MMSKIDIENFHQSLNNRDLRFLDSEYTKTTKELVKKFNATRAFLNKWWVITPTDWSCPVCHRKKSEIVHVNELNYLVGHLHEHHDHMKDIVKKLFEKACKKKEKIIADELSERFATKIAFALEAYDNTVICADCNKADGIAKQLVKTNFNFSFSPNEISEFIIIQPNVEHQIDIDKARNIWLEAQPTFELRMNWAYQFAEMAANKQDWYQPSSPTAKQLERRTENLYKLNGLLEHDLYFHYGYLYEGQPIVGANNSWRMHEVKINKAPSQKDLEFLKKMKKADWEKYNDDWICPSCMLRKIQCIRKNKKNQWILEIKKVYLFRSDGQQNIQTVSTAMCNDCCNTALHIGREVKGLLEVDVDFPSSFISLDELSKTILPRPHSKHEYQNEIIDSLLPVLIKRYEILKEKKLI
ncbi:hypothetical protein MWMV8_MWMV8_01800 [Acinetobacter calcoaceticus]|nr:hypothetical protein MWMV8_MWMV8_01800 [Acinetobacter calcoaceticus]